VDELVQKKILRSVKEVQREIERNCPFDYIETWVKENHSIFLPPSEEESKIVAELFKRNNIVGSYGEKKC